MSIAPTRSESVPAAGRGAAPRCVALVGPYLSGKTTLAEALLHAAGAVARRGSVKEGTTVGDSAAEARARHMSVEMNALSVDFMGDRWTLLDCPGSVELMADAQAAMQVADAVVVVCEPAAERVLALAPLFRFLDDRSIPHIVFLNKVDHAQIRIRDVLAALQAVSPRRLVLRQVPIRAGASDDSPITGYVDLVSGRAYRYRDGAASDLIQVPEALRDREAGARQELLEALADHDDALLERLLEDSIPAPAEIYEQIRKDMAADLVVPVLIGSAERENGVQRLWKALRHDVPMPEETARRRGLPNGGGPLAEVFRIAHQAHAGKQALARIWRGSVAEGAALGGERVGAVARPFGGQATKTPQAVAGEVVALGKLDSARAGTLLAEREAKPSPGWAKLPEPVFALAVHAANRNDEVKLSAAIARLVEEDPSLRFETRPDTGELVLSGQGEIHLQVAIDKLKARYNVAVAGRPPQVPYRETIRRGTALHSRFKRQSGGHGQFADIAIEVAPRPRGSGIDFADKVVGGAVPRQFIPAVEEGVREGCLRGPLGFPVVDVAVTLTGGQYHSVDSSEMAFKTVARQAMQEALAKCDPVLLEPILAVTIGVPGEFTAKVQRIVNGRRGQILGYDGKPGWEGWDEVRAFLPQAEVQDLIVELRSLTQGIGSYSAQFDHLAELMGKTAERVVDQRKARLAG
ncbi:MAG TPA: elongation factor G [Alphaproteobacteria bacterium]|nr:elongation factor G [Alphaproteobacteria bacterium]